MYGLCGYSRGFPGEGASNDSGVVENGNFQYFRLLFLQKLYSEANIIIQCYLVPRRLSTDPKIPDLE